MLDGSLGAARIAVYLTLLAAAGLPFYKWTLGRPSADQPMRAAIVLLAAAGAGASCFWAVASVAAMTGTPVSATSAETVRAVLAATPIGGAMAIRLAALAALAALAVFLPRPSLLTIAGIAALGTSAWVGHAGAGEGWPGTWHRLSDLVHLAAASLWLGALLCFLRDACSGSPDVSALQRFAATGTIVVVLLALTGSANALLIAGPTGWFASSLWTKLIAAKVLLFMAMLALASNNRWRLTPAVAAARPGARRRLAWSLFAETVCGVSVVALVGLAGMLDPAAAP
ncbi:copper homeostasis membrane protein CopD [Novosphingobium album (ex Hu et al. 2023)]|uniref:Copper homeostasis membrane protein CopD n=1 Tax=Novosphingobium album (ex Hu et al. 2023) TaxID=2930093 RepID=A0ABT0B7D8_9SPHN|nr:copper homeostasis membrane protein CopD [Novosphingobium album (ex Hu et al. 2023)]MCJ2180932.1 copper homeostasis membrane protein CopD [Novosphingobium album (ex Hu et al. 2023)]